MAVQIFLEAANISFYDHVFIIKYVSLIFDPFPQENRDVGYIQRAPYLGQFRRMKIHKIGITIG